MKIHFELVPQVYKAENTWFFMVFQSFRRDLAEFAPKFQKVSKSKRIDWEDGAIFCHGIFSRVKFYTHSLWKKLSGNHDNSTSLRKNPCRKFVSDLFENVYAPTWCWWPMFEYLRLKLERVPYRAESNSEKSSLNRDDSWYRPGSGKCEIEDSSSTTIVTNTSYYYY